MKHLSNILRMGVTLFLLSSFISLHAQKSENEGTIFHSSLHYTAKGMAYWYDEANGGLETITGVPYSQLGCQNCHVANCDRCHLAYTNETPVYSTEAAQRQEMCLKCHAREASILKIDGKADQLDVHFANGMTCMDCHTGREMHGDGVEYISMKQEKAMGTKCENCHSPSSEITSHTVHNGKVECKACHERHVVSCTNCHFETLVKEGKRRAIPVSGWIFLMTHNGKVTSANMQTFVVEGEQTFLMFAPQHSHSIMAKGRDCSECHATETMLVKGVNDGEHEIGEISDVLARLQLAKAYLSVSTRPPAENWVNPPNEKNLVGAYEIFREKISAVELLTGYEGNAFSITGNPEDDLLSITAVHPMRENAVNALLQKSGSNWSVTDKLLREKKLTEVYYNNQRYYLRK